MRKTNKAEIIKEAVRDFYGQYSPNAKPLMFYLTRRKRKPKLTEEQKDDLWHIRTNLSDLIYRQNIVKTLNR